MRRITVQMATFGQIKKQNAIMKKLLSIVMAAVLVALAAQAKGKANVTTTVFNADVTCNSCADKIMNNVPSLGKGVKDVKVDVDKKTVTVTYDSAKNNPANIVKGLASLSVAASEANAAAAAPAARQQCANIKAGGCCKRASEAKTPDCCKAKAAAAAATHTECSEAQPECKVASPAAEQGSCHGK